MKWRLLPSWRTLLIIVGIFFLALIVRLPASFMTLFLPQEIQLRDVQGSFWNGQASVVGVGGVLVQEQVSWNFLPRALLDARLVWAIRGRLADQTSKLELVARAGGVELNEVSLALPLEPLAALHPDLKSVRLGALLRVTAKSLSMQSPVVASVTVEHLFTPLVPQREFGSYRLNFKGETESRGGWQIATVAGVLRAAGQGTFDIGQLKFNGRLTLTPQSQIPGLSPLLVSLPKSGEGFVVTF